MIFLMLAEIMFTFENFGEREKEKCTLKYWDVRKTTNVIKKKGDKSLNSLKYTEVFVDIFMHINYTKLIKLIKYISCEILDWQINSGNF